MKLPLLLTSLIVVANSSLQCFNVHPSHAVSNSDSIAELFHVTAGECLNYCISQSAVQGDGCSSVVFHTKFNTCQLYGHDGTFNGAEVVYLEDHEFYIRSSWDGPCQDKVTPKRGYKQVPLQTPITQQSNVQIPPDVAVPKFASSQFPQEPSSPQIIRDGVRKAPSNFETQVLEEIERQTMEEEELENLYYTTTEAPRKPKSKNQNTITSFRNPTHGYKCASRGEKLSYFLVYGARLLSSELPQRLNGVDQASCMMYCSQNINAIGENIPCYSLSYEPTNEICEMYGKQEREKITWASLAILQEYNFGDKFCIQTKKDCPAETVYPVYLYQMMSKNIILRIPGINSKTACLAECIENSRCKAVTYKVGICILHSKSPASDSDLLEEGTEKTMVIENGCHVDNNDKPKITNTDVSQALASSWQEWSLCQYGSKGRKMRVRQRECDDCDEDLQMEEC